MLNFGASKPRVKGDPSPSLDTHLGYVSLAPRICCGGYICCNIGQYDTISKIELFPSYHLSSRDPNCKNGIQLFLQQFEKFSVYCVTNCHYKVLGAKQTSEWYFTYLDLKRDNF